MLAEYRPDQIVVSPSRKTVERLESYLKEFPQVPIEAEHKFAPGLYIRQIVIPKGVIMTGAPCRLEHLSVMVSGRMHVLADGVMKDVAGYNQWIAPAGVKRVGIALEDTVWFTVHPNPADERDVQALEDMLFEDTAELLHRRIAQGRATVDRQLERIDFHRVVIGAGFTAEEVRRQSEDESNLIPMPDGEGLKLVIGESQIEGQGVFLSDAVEAGELIAPARVGVKRTPAGRYTNHSQFPNAKFVLRDNGDIDLIAIRSIRARTEEVTLDYRQALALHGIQVRELPQ